MSDTVEKTRVKYEHLRSHLDEKVLRLWAAVEARIAEACRRIGYGHSCLSFPPWDQQMEQNRA